MSVNSQKISITANFGAEAKVLNTSRAYLYIPRSFEMLCNRHDHRDKEHLKELQGSPALGGFKHLNLE